MLSEQHALAGLAAPYGLDQRSCERLLAMLQAVRSSPHNLVSRRDRELLLGRHLADSLQALPILRPGALLDLGSGAGFPGLVLACCTPERRVVLVESNRKKAGFLRETAAQLELPEVEVVARRSEELAREPARRAAFPQLTVRAVSALPGLLELAAPLLELNGLLLAWKGKGAVTELERSRKAASVLGIELEARQSYRLEDGLERVLLRFRKRRPTPQRFPRRPGMAAHTPLL